MQQNVFAQVVGGDVFSSYEWFPSFQVPELQKKGILSDFKGNGELIIAVSVGVLENQKGWNSLPNGCGKTLKQEKSCPALRGAFHF